MERIEIYLHIKMNAIKSRKTNGMRLNFNLLVIGLGLVYHTSSYWCSICMGHPLLILFLCRMRLCLCRCRLGRLRIVQWFHFNFIFNWITFVHVKILSVWIMDRRMAVDWDPLVSGIVRFWGHSMFGISENSKLGLGLGKRRVGTSVDNYNCG